MATAMVVFACSQQAETAPQPTAEPTTSVAPSNTTVSSLLDAVQNLTTLPTKQLPINKAKQPTATPATRATKPDPTPENSSQSSPTTTTTVTATPPPRIVIQLHTAEPGPEPTLAPIAVQLRTPEPEPEPTPTPARTRTSGSMPQWSQDGVSDDEQPTVDALNALRYQDDELFNLVADMPFLRQHHHHDATAVRSLSYITYDDPEAAVRLIDAEHLPEGVTEENAPRISLAYAETLYGGDPAHVMYPERLAVTSKDITLASGSTATIAAARPPAADASRALGRNRRRRTPSQRLPGRAPANHPALHRQLRRHHAVRCPRRQPGTQHHAGTSPHRGRRPQMATPRVGPPLVQLQPTMDRRGHLPSAGRHNGPRTTAQTRTDPRRMRGRRPHLRPPPGVEHRPAIVPISPEPRRLRRPPQLGRLRGIPKHRNRSLPPLQGKLRGSVPSSSVKARHPF